MDKRVIGLITVLIVALGILPLSIGVYAQEEGGDKHEAIARVLIVSLERYVNLTRNYLESLEANGTEVPGYAWNNLTEAENYLALAREAYDSGNYTAAKSYALEGLGHIRDALSFLPLRVRVRIAFREAIRVEIRKLEFVINRTLGIVEKIGNETLREKLNTTLQEALDLLREAKDLLGSGEVENATRKVLEAKEIVREVLRIIDHAARVRAAVRAKQVAVEIAKGLDVAVEKINSIIERLEQVSSESNVNLTDAILELEEVRDHLLELKENLTSMKKYKEVHEIVKRLQHILTFNKIYGRLIEFKKSVVERRVKLMREHQLTGGFRALAAQIQAVEHHLEGLMRAISRMPWINESIREKLDIISENLHYAAMKLTDAVEAYLEGENITSYVEDAENYINNAAELLDEVLAEVKGVHMFPHGILRSIKTAIDRLADILEDFEEKLQRVKEVVEGEAGKQGLSLEKVEAALEVVREINETLTTYNYTSLNLKEIYENLNNAYSAISSGDLREGYKYVFKALTSTKKLEGEIEKQGFDDTLGELIELLEDLLKSTLKRYH